MGFFLSCPMAQICPLTEIEISVLNSFFLNINTHNVHVNTLRNRCIDLRRPVRVSTYYTVEVNFSFQGSSATEVESPAVHPF